VGEIPTVVMSDGEKTWVEPRPAYDTPRGNPALQPPTIFTRTERSPAEVAAARDLWFFDTRGYLVIKGVMDAAWLGAANEAFDLFATQPERIRLVPEAVLRDNGHVWPEGTSPLLKGTPAPGPAQQEGDGAIHRPRMGGLYTLPGDHKAPFRQMIANPLVVSRLNLMLGPGYFEAFEPMACNYIPGTCGGSLHAGPVLEYDGVATGYGLANGRAYCEGVNVSWALGDATAAEGGCFVCIPGGHKARYPYRGGGSHPNAIDQPAVKHISVHAGDVLIFIASGVPHGVVSWAEDNTTERRCVIQFNSSRNRAITPGQALGTALRNHASQDHPDSGGLEGACGLPGQEPPGWDLSEAGFETLCKDLGFASAEDYVRYKAATSVASAKL
jgi:hypothetical protein